MCEVLAVVTDRLRCRVAIVSGRVYINYPRQIISRSEAKYIALRFGHLFPDKKRGDGMTGQVLAAKVRREMGDILNTEDEISLSLLERTYKRSNRND